MNSNSDGKKSKKIFPSLKVLVACAMLAGLSFAIGWVCKTYMTFGAIRITFENIPILISGIVFGPVCGALVGVFSDLLSAVSAGYAINPIITAGAASVGLISGVISKCIFKNKTEVPRIFVSVISAHIVGSMIIKSIGLYKMGYAFGVVILRVPLYMLIGAIEFYLIYVLLKNNSIQREIKRIKG